MGFQEDRDFSDLLRVHLTLFNSFQLGNGIKVDPSGFEKDPFYEFHKDINSVIEGLTVEMNFDSLRNQELQIVNQMYKEHPLVERYEKYPLLRPVPDYLDFVEKQVQSIKSVIKKYEYKEDCLR